MAPNSKASGDAFRSRKTLQKPKVESLPATKDSARRKYSTIDVYENDDNALQTDTRDVSFSIKQSFLGPACNPLPPNDTEHAEHVKPPPASNVTISEQHLEDFASPNKRTLRPPSLKNDAYHVGWVCALASEMTAARLLLDEIHGPPQNLHPNDNNIYHLGSMQGHNVVIACLPKSEYGIANAAVVAQSLIESFPKIRFGLMVGIGGGIPDRNDVRLGDVVVSTPSSTSGGVIQFDFGKRTLGGNFERTGYLGKPPALLLSAIQTIISNYEIFGSKITDFIADASKTFTGPEVAKYCVPPDPHQDRLFRSDYQHQDQTRACDGACDLSALVQRRSRGSEEPRVHYGLIASGNLVVKHAPSRIEIAEKFNALCVEMEAGGLMDHFKCLVIRGICDYCDSHKNKHWQPYAAMTAAAFAKELLSVVHPQEVQAEEPILRVSDPDAHRLLQQNHSLLLDRKRDDTLRRLSDKYKRIHQDLKTINYEEQKNRHPDRVPGTCKWVVNSPTFEAWAAGPSDDLLWISSDPGCGKSGLAKSLIDRDLKATLGRSTCYFFFKDQYDLDELSHALCALLHQLFSQKPHLIASAEQAWDQNGTRLQTDCEVLWRTLLAAATAPSAGEVICILDGIDEAKDVTQQKLISFVSSFYRNSRKAPSGEGCLKFLITSRPYASIQRRFQDVVS
ncbi:MAG: hypothetical protein M1820_010375, partial [Bogoriella megaspora]